MPDGMSSENRPNTNPFASINSMGMNAAKNEFSPSWQSEKHSLDFRNQLDPREEATLMGRYGAERGMYERDPLGLYSAGSNYTESLLKFAKMPEVGSPEFNAQIETSVFRMKSDKRNEDIDEHKLKEFATREALKENSEITTELDRNYFLAVSSGNRGISETLSMLESFVPPKPFEGNMIERTLLGGRQALEATASYYFSEIPEKIVGRFREYDKVVEQQIGEFNILCAVGGGIEGYYDAVAQAANTLISRSRYHASITDFRAAYTLDNPGVNTYNLKDTEKAFVKDTLASKEIAETKVEMLSQARRFILFNADVAQLDMDKPDGEEGIMRLNPARIQEKINNLNAKITELRTKGDVDGAGRVKKHADSLEKVKDLNINNFREFTMLVFGDLDKSKWVTWKSPDTGKSILIPKEIQTWYADSDTVSLREEWESKMIAVLMWKSRNGENISDFLQNASGAEILDVAKEVAEKAINIRSNFNDKITQSNLDFIAAKQAVRSWIEKDKGFQKSGELAWKFKYTDNIKGNDLGEIVRLYDSGGLYKAYDSINLKYYWRRWTSYKGGLKSATTFFGPASDAWRREVSKHAPDWLPPLNRSFENTKIKSLHDRFFDTDPTNPDPDNRLWRAQRLVGDKNLTQEKLDLMISEGKIKEPTIDKKMQGWLLKTGWTFGSAYGVPIPMYLPKTFQISLDNLMKNGSETVDDLYRMGIMPKDVDWDVYNNESIDRMWVSMSMLTKFAHLFVDTYDEQRDPDFPKFFDEPGVQSIAEMAKRVYLAYRDLPEGYQPYILSIVPYMIAQHEASACGLLSTSFGDSKVSKELVLKQWNFKMAKWIRAAMWTPEVILDDQQLYDGANADIKSMRNDIALMIMYYKHIFEKVGQAAYKSDKEKLLKYYDDQLKIYGSALSEEMSPNEGEPSFEFEKGMAGKISENYLDGEKGVESALFPKR